MKILDAFFSQGQNLHFRSLLVVVIAKIDKSGVLGKVVSDKGTEELFK